MYKRGGRTLVASVVTAILTGVLTPLGAASQASAAPASDPVSATATASEEARAALTEQAAVTKAESTGSNVEITSMRSETSEVYADPDGRLEAVQHLRPVRARVDGGWKPIDNTLDVAGDGMVKPRATAVAIAFSAGGTGPLVSLERAGRKLAFSWPTSLPKPVLSGDTATYTDVLPDIDLRMRADVDGFHELLVVHSAEAAKNPALTELKLGVDAPGLSLKESAAGGLEAKDEAAGGVVFEAPEPLMWDSATTVAASTKRPLTQKSAAAGSDSDTGPGEASHMAPIGVEVAADGSELRLTPDQDMLMGTDTRFPVFIDPQTYTPKAGEWTMLSRYWADSPQWRFNGDSDAGMGYCEWDYCAPYDVKRLFYKVSTAAFAGKSVISATFVAHETFSASCDGREVQLWRVKPFSSITTWNNSKDDWLQHLDTRDVAHGGEDCAAGDVEFDATAGVKYAAAHNSSTTSFGLQATHEDDKYGWKRFSDDAYLRVKYNRPPGQIPMSHLSMDPGGTCKKPESKAPVRILPKIWAKSVTDPDKDQVSVQFQAYWDTGDGKGTVARWTSAKMTPKKSGSDFTTTLPSSIPKNKTVAWAARSVDYDQGTYYSYSPWSQTGSATACYFVYDTSVPAGPTITSSEYPPSNPEATDDPSYDGVGRYANFTLDVPQTDVTKYWFGVNQDPSAANTLTTTAGGAQTAKFRPTLSGLNFVTAQAFDAAGNGSEIRTYQYKVKAGQPARAQWTLDDPAGATQAEGSAGERTLQVNGTPTLGAPGAVGNAVTFNGTGDYLQSDIPTIDTSAGFSVAAWVNLSTMPASAAVIATQPGNNSPGFELYYSQGLDRWVFNQYTADTTAATPVRAMQAAAGGVKPGQWVHLAGTYSAAADLLSLYVDGTLAGTATYTTAWDARRGLQIGAGSIDGKPTSYFPGTIDDVRIYDKPLVQADVNRLATKQPIAAGRTARAVFPLDEDATQDNGAPTTEIHGRADVEPAVLKGGTTPGQPGAYGKALSLDGVDDYATTTSPHVNNQASYSVVAWAKLSSKPTHAGIVATQTGKARPGFELYYSATYGWSFNQFTADVPDAPAVRATQGDTTKSPAGIWTQLLGTYDAVTNQMQMYVNGALVATSQFSTPFYGSGPVQIGAGSYGGAPDSFFPGQIDDVQLYDRALSAPEASDLYRARPLVEGRWKLDTATGSPAVSPDDLSTVADQHPLTLGSGAHIDTSGSNNYVGTGGLLLDGTANSYAATAASPVHTDTSFTASAWVTAPGRPDHPVTVMSQAGSSNSGFTVRYVPDKTAPAEDGSWQLDMASTDSSTAIHTIAEHTNFQNNNSWNNIIVVFDAFADQMRLYVDGQLRQTLCADDDDDGSPNDAVCTEKVSWNSDVYAFDATKGLQLGRVRSAAAWDEFWSGAIDDVWMLQGAATEDQIAKLASGLDLATNPGP